MKPDIDGVLNPLLLRSFLGLAQHKSFQTAAERLGLAQPTISLHIRKLEEQLGVLLFQRARTGCELTAHAQVLLPYAQSLLRLNEQALRALHTDRLRIGASSNIGVYLLPPLLRRYLDIYPRCQLELTIDRNPVIATALENGELDIALMEWWDQRPGFAHRIWRHESVVVIVRPDHAWANRSSVTLRELAGAELLGGEPGTGTGALLAQLFADSEPPRVSLQLGSTEAVKQAVKAGLGISLVMAGSVTADVCAGSLAAIPLEMSALPSGAQSLEKKLFVIWRDNGVAHLPPPNLVAFLDGQPLAASLFEPTTPSDTPTSTATSGSR